MKPYYKILIIVTSIIIPFVCYINFIKTIKVPNAPLMLLIFLFVIYGIYVFLIGFSQKINLISKKKQSVFIGVSLFFALLLMICIPVKSLESHESTLEIIATGEKNLNAKASEVWVTSIVVDKTKQLSLNELKVDNKWNVNGGMLETSSKDAKIIWKGNVTSEINVGFVSHPWSGNVKIDLDGKQITKDLYSNDNSSVTIAIPTRFSSEKLFYYLANFYVIFVIIYVALVHLLEAQVVVTRKSKNLLKVLLYALPYVIVAVIYWLSFFPANMSADSIDQWGQAIKGTYSDAHPVFHTLCIWFITRIWSSPAAVVAVQIIFSSLIIGYAVYTLELNGVHKKIVLIILLLYSLNPANLMMSIVIWKDVPFCYGLFLITLLMVKIYESDGRWLQSSKNQVWLIVTCSVLYLVRHNGIISVIVGLFVLAIFYKQYIRQLLKVSIIVAIVILFVRFPLSYLLNVAPSPSYVALALPLQQVGTMVHNNVPLTNEEKNLLEKIMPLSYWSAGNGNNYSQYTAAYVIFHKAFNDNALTQNKIEFLEIWAKLVIRNPRIAFNDWKDMASIIWRVTQPADGYTYTVHTTIDPNPYNIEQKSILPSVHDYLLKIINTTSSIDYNWIFWRPATAILGILFFGTIFIIRNTFKGIIVLVPIIVQIAALLIVIPAQDARYFYYCSLILPTIIILSFCKFTKDELTQEEG